VRATGIDGKLLVAGRVAAILNQWELNIDQGCGHISATAVGVNEYWIEHATVFDVRLSIGAVEWRWKADAVSMAGSEIEIYVEGTPEVTDA